MTDAACEALAGAVADGFAVTPFTRSTVLSDEIGADVWVKDETGNVAGSHKARHLVGILLHLRAAETLGLLTERPPLAIASCGNAALAAATLAASVAWPIDVYVPTWMDDAFGDRLDELGARIHRCERRADDPPGDPAMLRFREASWAGAVPFTVQGPENGMCLDGGRTIGWEIAEQAADHHVDARPGADPGGRGSVRRMRRWRAGRRRSTRHRAGRGLCATRRDLGADHRDRPSRALLVAGDASMARTAFAGRRHLDDETYDWVADVAVMAESGGAPIVALESDIVAAHELAARAGFAASPTGTAGLAGLLAIRDELRPSDRVAVVMSGVAR